MEEQAPIAAPAAVRAVLQGVEDELAPNPPAPNPPAPNAPAPNAPAADGQVAEVFISCLLKLLPQVREAYTRGLVARSRLL
jgi:hypothetical protein